MDNKNTVKSVSPYCSQYLKGRNLDTHLKNIHPQDEIIQKSMFACTYCPSYFKHDKRLRVHLFRFHKSENQSNKNKVFICDHCQQEYRRKGPLINHIKKVHDCSEDQLKNLFPCNFCSAHFKTKMWLGRHITRYHVKVNEHLNSSLSDNVFNDIFKNLRALDKQQNTDILAQALEDTDVDLVPELDLADLKISLLNEKRMYHCQVCDTRFPKLSLLSRHMVVHGTRKPYKCLLCSMEFRYSSSLRHHAKEKHYFKVSNNRTDVFVKEFQEYVNKLKFKLPPRKVKKKECRKIKLNKPNESITNFGVINRSMPSLDPIAGSELIAEDQPLTNTDNTEIQTEFTHFSVGQNTISSSTSVKHTAHKNVSHCLVNTNSGNRFKSLSEQSEESLTHNPKFINNNNNMSDKTGISKEKNAYPIISEPIREILDNEMSLDMSLSDLPENCSFDNISLSEIDVQQIEIDDATIIENDATNNLTAKNYQDSSVFDLSNDLVKPIPSTELFVLEKDEAGYILQRKASTAKNNTDTGISCTETISTDKEDNYIGFIFETSDLTRLPQLFYILDDEIDVGQSVAIQNIGDNHDAQDTSMQNKNVECSNTIQVQSKPSHITTELLSNNDKDNNNIEETLNSLSLEVVLNIDQNEPSSSSISTIHDNNNLSLSNNNHLKQNDEIVPAHVLIDHTYIKTICFENTGNKNSSIIAKRSYYNGNIGDPLEETENILSSFIEEDRHEILSDGFIHLEDRHISELYQSESACYIQNSTNGCNSAYSDNSLHPKLLSNIQKHEISHCQVQENMAASHHNDHSYYIDRNKYMHSRGITPNENCSISVCPKDLPVTLVSYDMIQNGQDIVQDDYASSTQGLQTDQNTLSKNNKTVFEPNDDISDLVNELQISIVDSSELSSREPPHLLKNQVLKTNQNMTAYNENILHNIVAPICDTSIQMHTSSVDFVGMQNIENTFTSQYFLKDQINQEATLCDRQIELETDSDQPLSVQFHLPQYNETVSNSQYLHEDLIPVNQNSIRDTEIIVQTNDNHALLNYFNLTHSSEVASSDLLNDRMSENDVMLTYNNDRITQTNNNIPIFHDNNEVTLVNIDENQNDHILKNQRLTNQNMSTCNRLMLHTDNNVAQNYGTVFKPQEFSKNQTLITNDICFGETKATEIVDAPISTEIKPASGAFNIEQTGPTSLQSQYLSNEWILNIGESGLQKTDFTSVSTDTQSMPIVNFDIAQTSQEVLQSLLSDEPLTSVPLASISKNEHTIDMLQNEEQSEEKLLLKTLSTRNLKYMMTSGKSMFSCELCPAKFKRKSTLTDHKETHIKSNQLWVCDMCSKVFVNKKSLAVHFKYHNKKRIHCKVCGVLRHPLSMKSHMRSHNNEAPHSCPICKQTFKNISSRTYHLKVKHLKDFKLSGSSLVDLIDAVTDTDSTTNKTEANFPSMTLSSYENQHENVGKNKAKSVCKSLKAIRKLRLKEKKSPVTYFACDCGMLFKYKESLELHKLKYNNHPHTCQFSCDICREVFCSKSWLSRHLKTIRHKLNQYKTSQACVIIRP